MKTDYQIKVAKNLKGRDFIIGDIHGNRKRLYAALRSVDFDENKDRLFSLGDLIDRGKHNLTILALLYERDWFHAIRGNHEQMLINRYEYPAATSTYMSGYKSKAEAVNLHCQNGGKWFQRLRSETAKQRIYGNLSKLPYAVTLETENGNLGLVHSEVPGSYLTWNSFIEDLEKYSSTQEKAIWNRLEIEAVWNMEKGRYWEDEFQQEPRFIEGVVATVHGHNPTPFPIVCGNQLWIDTGYRAKYLTIIEASKVIAFLDEHTKK